MQHATPPAGSPSLPNDGRWILVVDDEPSMRMLIGMILQAQGWTVQTADGADSAMAAVKEAARPPSLVICDVLMPGLDGLELVRRMCSRIAGLSVVFISGHLTDVSWWPADLRGHHFLAKPFDNIQLVTVVREALADTGAAT